MPKALSKQQVHVFKEFQVQCINIWQEYTFNLHKDLPTLQNYVSSFQKLKDEAQKAFKKVERQVEYRFMFIATREAKVFQLQSDQVGQIQK